ncbi:MAG: serine/threonine-protein kinase [Gammaproteobacteria bacterium]
MRAPRGSISHLRRAALIGIAVTAAAHLPPLRIAQHLDSAVFSAWSSAFLPERSDIVIVHLEQPDAMAALAALAPPSNESEPADRAAETQSVKATVIGPSAIVLGPVSASAWIDTGIWALALAALCAFVVRRPRSSVYAWLLGIGGTGVLTLTSSTAFALSTTWVPVAGPGLMLLAAGSFVLLRPRLRLGARIRAAEGHEAARRYVQTGQLEAAWMTYRSLPPTSELLPDLFMLARSLEAAEFHELAADTYLRVAMVDPDFEDVIRRLVSVTRHNDSVDSGELESLQAQMPAQLGRYRLLEPIGQGTTGRVYLARDPKINRLVAIKVIDLRSERDEAEVADARERFHREAETTGRLSHKNIVTIFDMDEADGIAFIAMEYLKGDLLSRFTSVETLLPARLVLEIGALTADALDYAHSQNVIHRDIKPGNIMYDSVTGDLKITDFGIARLIDVNRTRTGVVLGTPSFMSPEQVEGGNVNRHTDLFALGVSLYELLTGQLPFRGASMTKLMFVIANEPHQPVTAAQPGLPVDLDTVIDTALSKDPAARYQSGADMANALRMVARHMV